MQQKIWSHKENETLKSLINAVPPIPTTKIAEDMGRSVDSVRHKIKWMRKQDGEIPVKVKKVVPAKKAVAKPVVKKAVNPVARPKALRQENESYVSYPPLEWCPTCHSPVSNWEDHRRRLGCVRPAA